MLKAHCDACGSIIPEGDRVTLLREIPGKVKRFFPFTFLSGVPIEARMVEVDLCMDCWRGLKKVFESVQTAADMADMASKETTSHGK